VGFADLVLGSLLAVFAVQGGSKTSGAHFIVLTPRGAYAPGAHFIVSVVCRPLVQLGCFVLSVVGKAPGECTLSVRFFSDNHNNKQTNKQTNKREKTNETNQQPKEKKSINSFFLSFSSSLLCFNGCTVRAVLC
jgi:hypothetical protein